MTYFCKPSVVFSLFFILYLHCGLSNAHCQETYSFPKKISNTTLIDSVEVTAIEISGNKITKEWVILRETALKVGAKVCLSELDSLLKIEANKIFNTDLFITSEVLYNHVGKKEIKLSIVVIEKFYTFPVPVIDVGDRNLNEWWKNRDRDFSRLVYGFTFKRNNFRGRNEKLKASFRLGFRQSLNIRYSIPFINKKRTVGLGAYIDYTTFNNLNYQTDANRLAFASADRALRKDLNFVLDFWNRKGYYREHKVSVGYRRQEVTDTLAVLNPMYFPEGVLKSKFFELSYTYTYDFRNIRTYPTEGHYLSFTLSQRGFGIISSFKQSSANITFAKYQPLSKRLYLGAVATLKYSTISDPSYVYTSGLGYGRDIVRGYDLYVVNGENALLSRNTLRFKLLDDILKFDFIPIKMLNTIPLALYPKVYVDFGYVQNRFIQTANERFGNSLMRGWGLGLDIVSFYNTVVRLEYSMNIANDNGLYFYWKTSI